MYTATFVGATGEPMAVITSQTNLQAIGGISACIGCCARYHFFKK